MKILHSDSGRYFFLPDGDSEHSTAILQYSRTQHSTTQHRTAQQLTAAGPSLMNGNFGNFVFLTENISASLNKNPPFFWIFKREKEIRKKKYCTLYVQYVQYIFTVYHVYRIPWYGNIAMCSSCCVTSWCCHALLNAVYYAWISLQLYRHLKQLNDLTKWAALKHWSWRISHS